MTASTLETLDVDECLRLLAGQQMGRLAFVDDGQPVVLPVNYLFDGGIVLVRTARGSKLDAAVKGERVAFEIDGFDAGTRTGWSVLVKGRCDEIWEGRELERVRRLPLQPWAGGEREHFLVVLSTEISGRRIRPAEPSAVLSSLSELWWG